MGINIQQWNWVGVVVLIVVTAAIVSVARGQRRKIRLRKQVVEANELFSSAHFDAAEELYSATAGECRTRGSFDHLLMYTCGHEVVRIRSVRGDLDGAESGLRAVIAEYDLARCPFRRGYVHLMADLAELRIERGATEEAVGALQQVVMELPEVEENKVEARHVERVLTIGLLVSGRLQEAERMAAKNVAAVQQDSAARWAERAAAQRTLATVVLELGRWDETERACREAVAGGADGVVGALEKLECRLMLAVVASARGEHERGYYELQSVLSEAGATYGVDHPFLLRCRFEIAAVLAWRGDAAASLGEHREVLDARTRILGASHYDTVKSREAVERAEA